MPELNLPTPGVTTGPEWASQLNAAITDINDEIETGRLSEPELSATFAPVYYDDQGMFADRGAVQTVSRIVESPTNLQPTVWVNVTGRGDNATFKGVAAGVFRAGDRPDVQGNDKGVLYALQSIVAPVIDRDNVPFDDVVGLSVENQGTGAGTDAIYFGKGRADKAVNPTANDWANMIACDANALTFAKASGTYTVGLSFSAATITTSAIRLGNNQSISANKADGSLKHLLRITAQNTLRLAEGAGGIDIRDAFGGIYAQSKIVMPNNTPVDSSA